MIHLERTELSTEALLGDAVIALYFSDQKPLDGPVALFDWRLDGQLTKMLLAGDVHGRAGEHVLLQSNGKFAASWILLVGGGKWYGLSKETHGTLVAHMLNVARQAGFTDVSLAFSLYDEMTLEDIQQQINAALKLEGVGLDACRFACESFVSA